MMSPSKASKKIASASDSDASEGRAQIRSAPAAAPEAKNPFVFEPQAHTPYSQAHTPYSIDDLEDHEFEESEFRDSARRTKQASSRRGHVYEDPIMQEDGIDEFIGSAEWQDDDETDAEAHYAHTPPELKPSALSSNRPAAKPRTQAQAKPLAPKAQVRASAKALVVETDDLDFDTDNLSDFDDDEAHTTAPLAQANPRHHPSDQSSDSDSLNEPDLAAISIPRIGIHFFLESAKSLKACERAAADRRMGRAECQIHSGGIMEAIGLYQQEPTPSLIVVESSSEAQRLLEELNELADVCDSGTKVVVIGARNDIRLYRELMRQGISEYLVAPVNPLMMIKMVSGLFNDPETPFVGRTLAFIGARGGAGASTLAHNLAYSISESMTANTVIIDYDLPFGTAGLDFNQDGLQGLNEALNEPDRVDTVLLDRMLIKCSERLSLLSAPATLDQDYDADIEAYETVTQKVRALAPFIIMDLPHVWTPWLRQNLIAADEVVIVATADLASLRNAKNIIDLLRASRPNDKPPRLVINQSDVPGRPEIPVKDFSAALGIEVTACIPFDPKLFGQASNNGQMIAQFAPDSKVNQALSALTCALTGRASELKKKTSFFAQLFKK